jgi:hypothetical protein
VNDTDRAVVLGLIRDLTRSVFSFDFESLFRHLDSNHDGMVELADLNQLIFCSIDVSSPDVTAAAGHGDGSSGPVAVYDEVLPVGARTGDDSAATRCAVPPPPLVALLALASQGVTLPCTREVFLWWPSLSPCSPLSMFPARAPNPWLLQRPLCLGGPLGTLCSPCWPTTT